ncbi:hypothetical protein [Devosia sp. FJ2-5-3]|nr:hypothetical protein [Devosia sp. FJ2-5-3]WEJ59058.1 hypothetical protein N0P34_03285 [Devosia sp. FJ2-5-3]
MSPSQRVLRRERTVRAGSIEDGGTLVQFPPGRVAPKRQTT